MQTPIAGKTDNLFTILKRVFTVLFIAGILITSLGCLKSSSYAASESWLNSTRTSILALDSARRTAIKELGNLSLSAQESADYEDFVIYLNTRIIGYCRELANQAALSALADLPCPRLAGLATEQAAASQQGEIEGKAVSLPEGTGSSQTEAEQTEQLHNQFLSALGSFDEMLLKEDEKVATRIPRQRETGTAGTAAGGAGTGSAAAGSTGTDGSGEFTTAGEQGLEAEEGSASAGASGTQSAKTGSNATRGAGRGGTGDAQARSGTPEGQLPPPEDDDIVARQLRDAAEKETDPELKKKLWEEYWKYKGVTPKGG